MTIRSIEAIEESCAGFARDWSALRRQIRDDRPWSILGHSMGALLARSLVEEDTIPARDVSLVHPDRAGQSGVTPGQGPNGDPAHEWPPGDQRQEDDEAP